MFLINSWICSLAKKYKLTLSIFWKLLVLQLYNLLKLINHMAATFDLQHKCTFFNIGNYKNIVAFKLKQQIISFLNWFMRIFTAMKFQMHQ